MIRCVYRPPPCRGGRTRGNIMTDNSRNDRRRSFDGRINTLGTGTNGVSRRGTGQSERRREGAEEAAEAPLADEEAPERGGSEAEAESEVDDADAGDEDEPERTDGVTPEADVSSSSGSDEERTDGVSPEADVSGDDDEEEAERSSHPNEVRTEDIDDRATLEIELDPFVRAYAARRAAESGDESLDEYVVGSVKGYLAGLLGGDVSSPGTLKREVDVEADAIFGGLLETIAGEDQTPEEVVIEAVADAYDVPVDEETLVVAGLRDHEALLNGVVANSSNSLNDISEVVQAAVETRLIEEPA